MVNIIGPRRSNVLIVGETGTGKEVVARALHQAGPRSQMPMVCVNCAAIPETLIESELFGHAKGAFTGAVNARPGKFEQANGGTIFLDEIGELPLNMQAKLLRVLQEREVQRLGSSETIKLDVRVIAATNADLETNVREGRFREDLFYRISVVPIELPPLRERMSDLAVLAEHFMEKICEQEDMPHKRLPAETISRLSEYHWPGNVRQLEHAVELAIIMSGSRSVLLPSDFSLPGRKIQQVSNARDLTISVSDHGFDYEATITGVERWIIQQALTRAAGNKAKAATMLGLKRTTLSAKTRALALDTPVEAAFLRAC
jgi:transcriptional regulator with GAF, ATPase, and Fis domain